MKCTEFVHFSIKPKDHVVPRHWDGDLLCGSPHSQIVTLVEDQSRNVMLIELAGPSRCGHSISPISR